MDMREVARARFAVPDLTPADCRGRIGVLFPFRGFDSVPCLVAAVELLCESGFVVDVFVPGGTEDGLSDLSYFETGRAGFPAFSESEIAKLRVARFVPYGVFERVAGPVVRSRLGRAAARKLAAEPEAERSYACLIGVDPEGLINAQTWSRCLGAPFMYWSLEILIREELRSPWFLRLKDREVAANRDAFLTIVQDKDRASLLAAQNDIPTDRIVYVPNAYRGAARRRKSFFAHQLLDISPEETVVLAPGSVAPWAMSEQIVSSASDWPEGFVLVVHARFDIRDNAYARRVVTAADPKRVRFSTSPLPTDEYAALIDSADIGLALYQPQQRERYDQGNLRALGLSSGKLAAFLRAGVPAIVSRLRGAADLVEEYECGAVIDGAEGLPSALGMVRDRQDEFGANAVKAFDGRLSVDRHFQPVLAALAGLARPTSPGAIMEARLWTRTSL